MLGRLPPTLVPVSGIPANNACITSRFVMLPLRAAAVSKRSAVARISGRSSAGRGRKSEGDRSEESASGRLKDQKRDSSR